MREILNDVAGMDHSKYDCLIVTILTHGRGVAAGPAGPALAGPLSHTPKTKQKTKTHK